jgi:hypothetical protein
MKTKKNMKNTIALNSILAVALGAFLTQSPALAGPAINGSGHVSNTAPNPIQPGPPIVETTLVEGATAKIHRNDKGVTVNIQTVGLKPNHVYTAWFVEVGVTGPGNPPQFLTGRIVGGSGKATFAGHMSTVVDAMAGEFHVVLADHGLKDPSTLPEEKTTFVPFINNGDGTWNYEQVAIFLPPSE